jgi:hypothetical protein
LQATGRTPDRSPRSARCAGCREDPRSSVCHSRTRKPFLSPAPRMSFFRQGLIRSGKTAFGLFASVPGSPCQTEARAHAESRWCHVASGWFPASCRTGTFLTGSCIGCPSDAHPVVRASGPSGLARAKDAAGMRPDVAFNRLPTMPPTATLLTETGPSGDLMTCGLSQVVVLIQRLCAGPAFPPDFRWRIVAGRGRGVLTRVTLPG